MQGRLLDLVLKYPIRATAVATAVVGSTYSLSSSAITPNPNPGKRDKFKHRDSVEDCIGYLRDQAKGTGVLHARYSSPERSGWNAWKTTDPALKAIVKKHFGAIEEAFALDATTTPSASSGKTRTHIISDNDVQSQNPTFRSEIAHSSVCSGGISALWAAYMLSALHKDKLIEGKPPVYILPDDIKHSASKGSSGQFHVSHATPMYTDEEFSAFNILFQTLRRTVTRVDPKVDNYMIAEIDLSHLDPKVIRVGLGYLWNEMQYKFKKALGFSTIADETIRDAITSGIIMDNIGRDLGKELLHRKNTLRVAYNKAETLEMEETQRQMASHGIVCETISPEEAFEKSGTTPKIGEGGSIWEVEGDGNISPNIFDILCQAIKANGGEVIESGLVSAILHDKGSKRVTGVVVDCGSKKGIPVQRIFRTNSVYTSFGFNAEYVADNGVRLDEDVEPIIPATGYSAYLLVRGDRPITRPVDSNNSHFTPFATAKVGEDYYTIVKTTCGGAIGTPAFNIDSAENSLYYAREIIFPGMQVDIICARHCSRPINTINSGRITEVLPGNYVATGFGGKGITDGAAFGAKYAKKVIGGDKAKRETFKDRYLREADKTASKGAS